MYINCSRKHLLQIGLQRQKNPKHEIHLLMVEQEDNHHFVLINDLSKMVGCQYNKNLKKQVCPHCLKGFQPIDTLKQHFEHGCLAVEGQRIQMPKEGEQIYFKNQTRKVEAPYVIHADFECLTMEYSSQIPNQ